MWAVGCFLFECWHNLGALVLIWMWQKPTPEVLVFGCVRQKGKEGACKSLSQTLVVVHEKINEHHDIEVSQFLSWCDEASLDWCFLKVATHVPLTRLVQPLRLQMCRLMYPSNGTLPLNKISLLLWQRGLNWVPCQFYQTVCYHSFETFSIFLLQSLLLLQNM